MIFFALLALSTLAARVIAKLFATPSSGWTPSMRWGMATALVSVGTDHLVAPERYIPMVPLVGPYPDLVVAFTGLCEIAGGIGLLMPRFRKLAGIMLAIYFVCVFPANIRNVVAGLSVDGLPGAAWYYWVRLLFQPVAVWWALHAAEVLKPRRAIRAAFAQSSGAR